MVFRLGEHQLNVGPLLAHGLRAAPSLAVGQVYGGNYGFSLSMVVGFVALPAIHSMHRHLISESVPPKAQDTPKGEINDALGKKRSHQRALFKTAVIGYNTALTLGSLLQLPFASNTRVVLFEKGHIKEIDLDRLDRVQCERASKICLHLAHGILQVRNFVLGSQQNALTTCLGVSATTWGVHQFAPKGVKREDRLFKFALITSTMATSLGMMGWILKNYGCDDSKLLLDNPKELPSPPPEVSDVEPVTVTVDPLPEQHALTKYDEELTNEKRKAGLGSLSILPRDVLNVIASELKGLTVIPLAQTSKAWASICVGFNARKHYILKHVPRLIIDAVGLERLALMETLKLNDSLYVPPPRTFRHDFTLDYLVEKALFNSSSEGRDSVWHSNAQYLKKSNLDGYAKSYSSFVREKLSHFSSLYFNSFHKALPSIYLQGKTKPDPLIFFLTPGDLKKNRMVLIWDAAGRLGIAFQYIISYRSKLGVPMTAPGVAVLHQLHPNRPDLWVWIDSHYPDIEVENGDIKITQMDRDRGTDPSLHLSIREFLFLHPYKGELGPECQDNLAWLKKFSAGQECGWLHPGKEAEGPGVPRLVLTSDASDRSYMYRHLLRLGIGI